MVMLDTAIFPFLYVISKLKSGGLAMILWSATAVVMPVSIISSAMLDLYSAHVSPSGLINPNACATLDKLGRNDILKSKPW